MVSDGTGRSTTGTCPECLPRFQACHPSQSALRTGVQCPHLHDRGSGNQQLPEDGIQIEANGCERQEPGISRPGLLCHRQHTSQPGRYPSGYCCIRKGCSKIKPQRSRERCIAAASGQCILAMPPIWRCQKML